MSDKYRVFIQTKVSEMFSDGTKDRVNDTKDSMIALKFRELLEDADFEVYLSKKDAKTGEEFEDRIEKFIDSSDAVIMISSNHKYIEVSEFIQKEITQFVSLYKKNKKPNILKFISYDFKMSELEKDLKNDPEDKYKFLSNDILETLKRLDHTSVDFNDDKKLEVAIKQIVEQLIDFREKDKINAFDNETKKENEKEIEKILKSLKTTVNFYNKKRLNKVNHDDAYPTLRENYLAYYKKIQLIIDIKNSVDNYVKTYEKLQELDYNLANTAVKDDIIKYKDMKKFQDDLSGILSVGVDTKSIIRFNMFNFINYFIKIETGLKISEVDNNYKKAFILGYKMATNKERFEIIDSIFNDSQNFSPLDRIKLVEVKKYLIFLKKFTYEVKKEI